DPPINDAAAVALGLATEDDLAELFDLATAVNDALRAYFAGVGLDLVDLKLDFGRLEDGSLVLADEVSPDTCRLWDLGSGERLDKDRFRRDLGGVEDAYAEVLRRVSSEAGDPERFAASFEPPEDSPFGDEEDAGPHDHAGHRDAGPAHEGDRDGGHGHAHGHRAVVSVMLKPSILDPQGRAVLGTLTRLGYDTVRDVRVGKRIEVALAGEPDRVRAQLADMAEKVLSNPVMEAYELELEVDGVAYRRHAPRARPRGPHRLPLGRRRSRAAPGHRPRLRRPRPQAQPPRRGRRGGGAPRAGRRPARPRPQPGRARAGPVVRAPRRRRGRRGRGRGEPGRRAAGALRALDGRRRRAGLRAR